MHIVTFLVKYLLKILHIMVWRFFFSSLLMKTLLLFYTSSVVGHAHVYI